MRKTALFVAITSAFLAGTLPFGAEANDQPPPLAPLPAVVAPAIPAPIPALLPAVTPPQLLKSALRHELARLTADPKAGLVALPDGKALHPGDRDPQVPTLRLALQAFGYLPVSAPEGAAPDATMVAMPIAAVVPAAPAEGDGDGIVYDQATVAAVKRFQRDIGLKDDGIVGDSTRRALRAMDGDRILMLQQSLAQPNVAVRGRYILVNVAAGMVYAMDGKTVVVASRAVVGKATPDTQTPVFSARISSVTLNPVWTTPDSISEKEFGGDTHIEKPGPQNPLGKFRLDMPNGYEVFLHSTNQPYLFNREIRTFSHGCVRVEQIDKIAKWLIGDQVWASIDADGILAGLKTRKVPLDHSVPIYIQYRTATLSDTGAIIYHPDPYQLAAPPPPPLPPPVPPGYIGPPGTVAAPATQPGTASVPAQTKAPTLTKTAANLVLPPAPAIAATTAAPAPGPAKTAGIDVLAPQ